MGAIKRLSILLILGFVLRQAWNFYHPPKTRDVKIKQGILQGFQRSAYNGEPFWSFTSIPYAEPPVGERRFRRPEHHNGWEGIRVSQAIPQCATHDNVMSGMSFGQEDCLYLSVHTRSSGNEGPSADHLLPVLLYIHGGGFTLGSAQESTMGPEIMMQENMVLVQMNYRLGVLGFLSTGDSVAAGNLGLWDQLMALKWVKENIRLFGGDPNQVTLGGISAGSMSVSHHVFSPRSNGLFQRAIMQSGVSSSAFGWINKNPSYYARSLASLVECDPEASTLDLVNCLRQVDVGKLTSSAPKVLNTVGLLGYPFLPVVDSYFGLAQDTEFFPDDPWNLLEEGKFNHNVSILMGCAQFEGLFYMGDYVSAADRGQKALEHIFSDPGANVPSLLNLREADEMDATARQVGQDILEFYFRGGNPPDLSSGTDQIQKFSNLFGDSQFNVIGTITARKMASLSPSPVYEYVYNHMGTVSTTDIMIEGFGKYIMKALGLAFGVSLPLGRKYGPCHGDDQFLIFTANSISFLHSPDDQATSRHLVTLFSNFMRAGNPNIGKEGATEYNWKRLSPGQSEIYTINSSPQSVSFSEDYEKRVEFWRKVYEAMPPTLARRESKTWSNAKLYKGMKSPDTEGEAKNEL